MDVPFTKINLTMFMTYATMLTCKFRNSNNRLLNYLSNTNRLLGAVTFNTSMGIMLPWESVRFIYPYASQHMINKTTKQYNISRRIFEFINFTIHIFPVIYLISVRKHWNQYSSNIKTVILSMLIHAIWVKSVPKHYNLNRIYLFGDNILNNSQWIRLWILAIIGHFTSYGITNGYKILS
jgi:hypothetical protein